MTGRRMHKCAARGCDKQTSARMLMCLADWKRVPVELQRALYKVYRRAPGGDGAAVLTREYVAAARACVEAVRVARAKERGEPVPAPLQYAHPEGLSLPFPPPAPKPEDPRT
jgi:hypothetical protein